MINFLALRRGEAHRIAAVANIVAHQLQRLFYRRRRERNFIKIGAQAGDALLSLAGALNIARFKICPDGVDLFWRDVCQPGNTGGAAINKTLVYQRIRAVQHVKIGDIPDRIEETLQAFVAAGAVFDADNVRMLRQRARGLRFMT